MEASSACETELIDHGNEEGIMDQVTNTQSTPVTKKSLPIMGQDGIARGGTLGSIQEELEAELRTALAPSVRAAAGLPDEHEAEILLRAIAPTLLAA